jgi:pimeloyl-ACP methyl ester carboxylesterase
MAKVVVNDIKFHYWRVGQGPDVIMLHGLSGNLAVWHFTMVPELKQKYRVTTYDLRGHGHSEMPPSGYTTRDMAGDLRGIMDALEIDRAFLLGHSLGADVAMHFALLHPERVKKIVAIEAGIAALVHLRKSKDWPGWEYWAKTLEKYGGIKVPREKWTDIGYMLRESTKVPILFGPARGLPRKADNILKLIDTTTMVQDYQNPDGMTLDAMRRIQPPVLLVYGSDSQYIGTHGVLKEVLPNCRTVLMDGVEHLVPLERPEELIRHVVPFFEDGRAVERGVDSESPR